MADSLFGKGIPLGMNFDLGAEQALDARTVVNTYAELSEHVNSGRAYPGLTVYVIDEDKKYRWTGSEWKKDGGSGSANFIVATYQDIDGIRSEDPIRGSLIYVESDSNKAKEPNVYLVTEQARGEDRLYYPSEYKALSTFAKSQVPVLSYHEEMPEGKRIYKTREDNIVLKFNFTSDNYGDGKYRIYKNESLLKTWSGPKGLVIVDLGKITTNGEYELAVTAEDYFGIPSEPKQLKYQLVVGGLELTSSFEENLKEAIYQVGDSISFPFKASVSDTSQRIKMFYKIYKQGQEDRAYTETEVTNYSEYSGTWKIPNGAIYERGEWTIEVQGYTGESLSDTTEGTFISNKVSYTFLVLDVGELGLIYSYDKSPDSNTFISIPFRIIAKDYTYFHAKCTLYEKIGDQVNRKKDGEITNIPRNSQTFWALGKLSPGTYICDIVPQTPDWIAGKSHKLEFVVSESSFIEAQPVTANLVAWFDAKSKRNTDEDRNIWENRLSNKTYKIKLEGLNYISNGWKHIDPNKSDLDDGEFVLKMTGDSYGYMVRDYDGTEVKYEPLSIFKDNAGQAGFAFEIAFKTQCIGELNARVVSFIESLDMEAPGLTISYDKMNFNSDSTKLSLDFMENEWIHATFVIDNDIRTLDTVGQGKIENLNPMATLRIYINGVLCGCKLLSGDSFCNKNNEYFPLVLNSTYDSKAEKFENFGECEIKFIRIYNGILTSEDVLQNYISHFFDTEKQMELNNKNNADALTLPKVVFTRHNKLESEQLKNSVNFDRLHSITIKADSKKEFVDCTMNYYDTDGKHYPYNNINLFLQGTSSLQYPVKNYQIKNYDDNERKIKKSLYVPGFENKWKVPCYTYTLKADYMEQSHMNNTPTAVFYNKVIDVITGGDPKKLSPARRDGYLDAIDGAPCIVYYNNGEEDDQDVLVGSFMFNVHKDGDQLGFECDLYDDEGNVIGNGKDSCISYEATANSTDTAGCFFTLEESIDRVYEYATDAWWKEYLKKQELEPADLSFEQFKEKINNNEVEYQTFEEFKNSYSVYDYVSSDFEPRWAYNEDDEELMYRPIINLIEWVSSCYDGNKLNKTKFEEEFNTHLSMEYCLVYFLQMMLFTQVDNCGKNSMWDTWDGIKFYPRPYDMDTSNGLSNTGTETIQSNAEILESLSPTMQDSNGQFVFENSASDTSSVRYMSYNTKTNRLWNAFATVFKDEISSAYNQLRSRGVYTLESITQSVFSMTVDVIGETYYNKDAASKYLSQISIGEDGKIKGEEYLKMLHGNRVQKYKKHLSDRLLFLDTIYSYYKSDTPGAPHTLNSQMTFRSDATVTETIMGTIGISVYTPTYIKVVVGSGHDATLVAYVGPESRYIDPRTNVEKEGTLFKFPIKATDKEAIIYGAGNIKKIDRLETLDVRDIILDNAEKIIDLNLSYSRRMAQLKLGNNKFLRNLNCSNSRLLGSAGALNLEKCVNLQYIDLSNTPNLRNVSFPENSNLKEVNLEKCASETVIIDGAEFLTNVNINGCDSILDFTINNCPKMQEVQLSGTSTNVLKVTNSNNVKAIYADNCHSITSLDFTGSKFITKISMSNNSSPVLNSLDLSTIYNLEELYIDRSTTLKEIKFPSYASEEDAKKAAVGDKTARIWENLKKFNVASSTINKIQYGSVNVNSVVVDMTQLTALESLTINNCTSITEIKNINFYNKAKLPAGFVTGSLQNKFQNCSGLKKITGVLYTDHTNASGIFSGCTSLNNIDGLTLTFPNVTTLSSAFNRASSCTTKMVKKLLDAAGGSLTDVSSMCNMYQASGTVIIGTDKDTLTNRMLPSDLFKNTENITTTASMFAYCPIQKVPGDLLNPMKDKLTSVATMFAWASSLTEVGNNFLKNKPKLKDISRVFCGQSNFKNYINYTADGTTINDTSIFSGSSAITNATYAFHDCQKLVCTDLEALMDPLTNLEDCKGMFSNCKAFACPIPEGFLSNNIKIKSINNMFRGCSGLTDLPRSIFRKSIVDTTVNFDNLTSALGTFGNCSNLTGIVSESFFDGAKYITNIGGKHTDAVPGNSNIWSDCGFFEGCKITGYYEGMLAPLTRITSCSRFFLQGDNSSNKGSLVKCYYFEEGTGQQAEYNNSISEKLFNNNSFLTDVSYMFYNCNKLTGHIPETLFENIKSSLVNASYMFTNSSTLNGRNLDEDNVLSKVNLLFRDCPMLTSVASFFKGCSNYDIRTLENMFIGCSSLKDVSNLFNGCTTLNISEIPVNLFEDCRNKLEYTNGMFASTLIDCGYPVGTYHQEDAIIGYEVCLNNDPDAMNVVPDGEITDPMTQVGYRRVLSLSPGLVKYIYDDGTSYVKVIEGKITVADQLGLLADCFKLKSTASMFSSCENFGSGYAYPTDLFFSSDPNTNKFESLTDVSNMFNRNHFNKAYVDSLDNTLLYWCSPDLFNNCPNITNMSHMFWYTESMPACEIPALLFDKQYKLQTTQNMFGRCYNLKGTMSSQTLRNSIGSLEDTRGMFMHCNLTKIESGFLNQGDKNTKLKYMWAMFYSNNNLTGSAPEFWNKQLFTKIDGGQSGYYGAFYETNIDNMNRIEGTNWVVSQTT